MSDPSDEFKTNELIKSLKWAEPAQESVPKVSLDKLLMGLRLLASDDARKANNQAKWDEKTPASIQVIESGALEVTRHLTKLVTRAGGCGASIVLVSGGVATLLKTFIAHSDFSNSIIVTLFGGAFVLFSATAIAVSLLVRGDLQARGSASAARHQARGQVAAAFLQATATLHDASSPPVTGSASPGQPDALWVRPMTLVGDPNPWRRVLGYDRVSAGDPPQEQTFYLVQVDPGQQPQWKSSGELDGWKVSASAPTA